LRLQTWALVTCDPYACEEQLPKTVATNIEQSLRQRIAAGEWSANGRLPPERDLAVEYRVARNTLRRAIQAIMDHGMLERHIGRGTFLNDKTGELCAIIRCVTGASPADLIALRLIIEPQAAAITAKNADSSDLQAIAEAHFHATKALQTDEFEHWDSQFHQRLFAATRNELLLSIHSMLQSVCSRYAVIEMKKKYFSQDRWQDYCAQHANVVTALANRDAYGAARAMLRSVKAIEAALFGRQ
jgi:DNA-binding FadR family transcriptional regulator